jgi:cytidine deaminase
MQNLKFSDLNQEEQNLLNEAEKALVNAYNPYNSKTRIGVALQTNSGKIFIGSSIANASSTVNLCAERIAIGVANSQGHRDIKMMAMTGTDSDGVVENPVMPCGVCRQFMEEFITINKQDIIVLCSNSTKDIIIKTSLQELLPLPYGGSGEVK